MVKLKPLFLSLSMITSLAVAGCSSFSKESAERRKVMERNGHGENGYRYSGGWFFSV